MTRLVDAATLADTLGTSRAYVYAHAEELGAIRLGATQRTPERQARGGARLRFDLEAVLATLGAETPDSGPEPQTPPRPQRDRSPGNTAGSILRARSPNARHRP